MRSSYRTVRSDSLVVVVSLGVESDFSGTSLAQYTDPSGRDVDQVDALAPPALPAGSVSTIALVFPAVDPGGRLTWQLSPTEAGADVVIDLEVPALLGGADHAVPPGAPAPPSIPGSTVSTKLQDLEPEVVDALNRALGTPFGASDGGFPEPEEACVNAAIAALPPSTRDAINQLASDSALFDAMNNELARVIATAYVGCVGNLALAGFLAAVQTFAVQGLDCLADTWKEIPTPDAVAASLAYGHGLNDLPDAIVNELTLATAGCVPEQWWIDDETAALARAGLDNSQASCVATMIVDTFGIAPIIRRRILGFDLLPIPQSELDALEFPARCNMQFPRLGQLNARRAPASPASAKEPTKPTRSTAINPTTPRSSPPPISAPNSPPGPAPKPCAITPDPHAPPNSKHSASTPTSTPPDGTSRSACSGNSNSACSPARSSAPTTPTGPAQPTRRRDERLTVRRWVPRYRRRHDRRSRLLSTGPTPLAG